MICSRVIGIDPGLTGAVAVLSAAGDFELKRALGLSIDKRASLDKARLLFPTADLSLAKHDGRAEALLLAYWSQRRQWGAAGAA